LWDCDNGPLGWNVTVAFLTQAVGDALIRMVGLRHGLVGIELRGRGGLARPAIRSASTERETPGTD
jgi:hypothetical protein